MLAAGALLTGLALGSGFWDQLSVLREYASRSDTFGREVRTHAGLALSSVAAATAIGIPAAILARPVPALRTALALLLLGAGLGLLQKAGAGVPTGVLAVFPASVAVLVVWTQVRARATRRAATAAEHEQTVAAAA